MSMIVCVACVWEHFNLCSYRVKMLECAILLLLMYRKNVIMFVFFYRADLTLFY